MRSISVYALPMGADISLAGKVVLVTGGSRGVGAETVRLFARAGARVVFSYKSSQEAATALVAACGGPEHCRALQQDLGSSEEGRALVENAIKVWGRLDALVANHGVWPPHDASIDTMDDGQWRDTMGVNLDSVFGLVKGAVAHFKARPGPAHIVFVASTAAQRGEAFHADYAASKGALIALTKSLSSELAKLGILVNCVAPGWIATDMSAPALATEAGRSKIFATIPLGRVATTAEIAGPIVFLCSPWAGFISGEVVNVNGGAVLVG
jgi:3-oxoacyl-[acyl-carrier protein] reductase